jgi:hypothetical protein
VENGSELHRSLGSKERCLRMTRVLLTADS